MSSLRRYILFHFLKILEDKPRKMIMATEKRLNYSANKQ